MISYQNIIKLAILIFICLGHPTDSLAVSNCPNRTPYISQDSISQSDSRKTGLAYQYIDHRIVDPGSFPSFGFLLKNLGQEERILDFIIQIPLSWKSLTFKKPVSILGNSEAKVRITLAVPKNASADSVYSLNLIVKSPPLIDTMNVRIGIRAKPAFKVLSMKTSLQTEQGDPGEISYVLQNDGNVTDTIQVEIVMPADWEKEKIQSSYILQPLEKRMVDIPFKVPKTANPHIYHQIRFSAKSKVSITSGREIEKENITRIEVNEPDDKEIVTSLYPTFPVYVGFALNRIQKDRYPEAAFYLQTGRMNLGDASAQFAWTHKSNAADIGDQPSQRTERLSFAYTGESFDMTLGDVVIEFNPLLSTRSSLIMTDLKPLKEIGRGVFFEYRHSQSSLSLFHGKRIFTDDEMTLAIYRAPILKNTFLISSFNRRYDSNIATFEGQYLLPKGQVLRLITGISKPDDKHIPTSGAFQLRGSFDRAGYSLTTAIHWAGDVFQGPDRGKSGLILTSRWIPSEKHYIWNHVHIYNQNWAHAVSDSSAFITDLRTRILFHFRKWPMFNIGYNWNQRIYSFDKVMTLHNLDFQIQKYLRFGLPAVRYKVADSIIPTEIRLQRTHEIKAGMSLFFGRSRIRYDHTWGRLDESPWGKMNEADLNLSLRRVILSLYISSGRIWYRDFFMNLASRNVTNFGIRSNIMINPFGRDYRMTFEVGKAASRLQDFKDQWRFSLSISMGVKPRFNLPVPFVKTKGQLKGELFIDKNGDGVRSGDEPGIPHVVILLGENSVISDGEGLFEFPSLEENTYPLSIDETSIPAYLSLSKPVPTEITIQKGEVTFISLPMASLCSVGGMVYMDDNKNQHQDQSEKFLASVRVILRNQNGREWEAYTDKNGYFRITDLLPGLYTVTLDNQWLPKRTQQAQEDLAVVLTHQEQQQSIRIAVIQKTLEVRRTFQSPKK